MTAGFVIACIVLALLLLGLIRVGGSAEYSQSGLLVRVKLGPLQFTAYPRAAKAKKKQKSEKPEKDQSETPAGGSFQRFRQVLPLITQAAGQFRRKLRIDTLHLDYTAAAENPALAALEFGYANAAIGMVFPLLEHNFNLKERRIRTAVDFNLKQPVIYLFAAFSITIGQGVLLGIRILIGMMKQSSTKIKKEKEAV
ncbi:MAG: DUF2953 domain-containing protein [Pseudoflavonifractor sp.]